MKTRALVMAVGLIFVAGFVVLAQGQKPASPAGTAAAQVLGKYVKGARGESYQGGKWIEVTYGRPILRGRQNIFGIGADYGKTVSDGSPVWRAGANQTTRLKTEVPLIFEGKTLPVGEYCVFVDLKRRGVDPHLFQLAGPGEIRPEQQSRTVGFLRIHAGQGCSPRKHDARFPPVFGRAIHDFIHRHDGGRGKAGDDVGQNHSFRAVQGRKLVREALLSGGRICRIQFLH